MKIVNMTGMKQQSFSLNEERVRFVLCMYNGKWEGRE